MDAINLQGIWLDFPKIVAMGKTQIGAGLFWMMLEEEMREDERKRRKRDETALQKRTRIMQKVEDRLIQEESDDLVTILAI